jgi:hypothetical protein
LRLARQTWPNPERFGAMSSVIFEEPQVRRRRADRARLTNLKEKTMKWILAATLAAALPLAAQGYGKEKTRTTEKETPKTAFELSDTDGNKVVTLDEIKQQRADMREAYRKSGEADDWVKACEDCMAEYDRKLSLEKFLKYDTNDNSELTATEFSNAEEGTELKLSDGDRKLFADIHFDDWAAYANASGDEIDLSSFRDAMAKRRAAIRAQAAADNPEKVYAMNNTYSVLRDYRKLLIVDVNKDGKVTRAESFDFWKKKLDGLEMTLDDKNKELYAEQLYLERVASLDSNEDGALTRDEVAIAEDAPTDADWNKLDRDGNDSLSKDEILAWDEPTEAELKAARRESEKEKEKEHEKPETPQD